MLDSFRIKIGMLVKTNEKAKLHGFPVGKTVKITAFDIERPNWVGVSLENIGYTGAYSLHVNSNVYLGIKPNWGISLFDHIEDTKLTYKSFDWGI